MAVYMILEADVHDPEAYEKYKQAAPQYVARHGGEYCVRGCCLQRRLAARPGGDNEILQPGGL